MYSEKWANPVQSMRSDGDILADTTIAHIFDTGALDAVNDTLRKLFRNDDIPVADMHPAVKDYLEQSARLPAWADREKMRFASHVFDLHGVQMVMMLFGASLPTTYAAHKGAQVLVLTERMANNAILERRIIETAQFVMDVTEHGAFEPQGRGIVAVQKVRLIHAAVSRLILYDPYWKTQWDESWGCPINQVDMAGTMLSFSTIVLQGMERSNIHLTLEEKEAYVHLWKVIGHMLGVQDALMPVDYQDSIDLIDTILQLNHEPSEAGKLLASTLVNYLHRHIPFFKSYVTDTMRHLVGHDAADILGLPDYQWTMWVFRLQRGIWWIESRLAREVPLFGHLSRTLNRRFLVTLLKAKRGGNRPTFRLPSTLREKLDLGEKVGP